MNIISAKWLTSVNATVLPNFIDFCYNCKLVQIVHGKINKANGHYSIATVICGWLISMGNSLTTLVFFGFAGRRCL